jgi:hypothetical protein
MKLPAEFRGRKSTDEQASIFNEDAINISSQHPIIFRNFEHNWRIELSNYQNDGLMTWLLFDSVWRTLLGFSAKIKAPIPRDSEMRPPEWWSIDVIIDVLPGREVHIYIAPDSVNHPDWSPGIPLASGTIEMVFESPYLLLMFNLNISP